MSTNKLTIVPVIFDHLPTETSSFHSSQYTTAPSRVSKTDISEIAFFKGVDKSIIQTIMKELKHLTSVQNIYIICGKMDMRKGRFFRIRPI